MREMRTRRQLWTATGLLVVVFLCAVAARVSEIDARARQQGSYCLGTGPHPSGLAMVPDDGGETWQTP